MQKIKDADGKRKHKNNHWAGCKQSSDKQEDCLFGGTLKQQLPNGSPVGQTKVYLGKTMRFLLQPDNTTTRHADTLTSLQADSNKEEANKGSEDDGAFRGGIIAVGGGQASKQELQFAYDHHIPVA